MSLKKMPFFIMKVQFLFWLAQVFILRASPWRDAARVWRNALRGRCVWVTGATQGLGEAVAYACAALTRVLRNALYSRLGPGVKMLNICTGDASGLLLFAANSAASCFAVC